MKPRERIIKEGSLLFHLQGYNSTGINEIIEKSKVAKATFYQHFRSKEDLAAAYLEQRHENWFNGLELSMNSQQKPKEKILSAFDYIKELNNKEDYRGCSFLNMLSEIQIDNTRLYKIIQSHKSDLQQFFKEIIADMDKSFLVYMLFEACIIETQIYRSQDCIDKAKKNISNLIT